jgi:hypothetical protein
MATPIATILVSELKVFYPVTDSLSQAKIDEFVNNVRNVIFMQMFGYAIANKIFAGTIEDSATDNFMGFRKFTALCTATQFAEETFIHTNAGLKIINQPNWGSPTAQTKNTTLMKLNNAIEVQFLEAKSILKAGDETPANDYVPYSSFEIEKI